MSSPKNSRLFQYVHFAITTLCFIGFSISFYTFFVEMKAENDPNYVAMCDINEHMSCTKAFMSEYGKGFGLIGGILGKESRLNLPNCLYGMMFYTLYFFLNVINFQWATLVMIMLGALSNVTSLYLAYILIFILRDFCVVCVATYFVNASLLFFTLHKKNAEASSKVALKHQAKKQS